MSKKIILFSVLFLETLSAFALQLKTPIHEQSSLKGIAIQVAFGGGTEKTEGRG